MNNGPSLVIRGTFLGSLLLALLGWFLAGQIKLSPTADVAYAADEPQTGENSSLPGNCQVSLSYPIEILQWCAVIMEQATQNDLPANLLAAVILQESGGDADAYSGSGAVGLMQVMPRDGIAADFECINGPCFADRPTIEELQDPSFNVEYASHMLSGLIATLGSQREALESLWSHGYGLFLRRSSTRNLRKVSLTFIPANAGVIHTIELDLLSTFLGAPQREWQEKYFSENRIHSNAFDDGYLIAQHSIIFIRKAASGVDIYFHHQLHAIGGHCSKIGEIPTDDIANSSIG